MSSNFGSLPRPRRSNLTGGKRSLISKRAPRNPYRAIVRRQGKKLIKLVMRRAFRKKQPTTKKIGESMSVSRYSFRGSKRYATRPNKRMIKYGKTLQHIMTEPKQNFQQSSLHLSSMGTNSQAKCQWYMDSPLNPSTFDLLLQQAAQTGGGTSGVDLDQECFIKDSAMTMNTRNNGSHGCQLTGWILFPRRDIPSAESYSIYGINPTILQQGFTDQINPATGPSSTQVLYTQYNATPYNSSILCKTFKIKNFFNVWLEPGAQHNIKCFWNRGLIIDKARYGTKMSRGISQDYGCLRDCGPLVLLRVQGTPVHDESQFTVPVSSGTGNVTASGFNLDVVMQWKINSLCPYVTATRSLQNLDSSTLPANITAANEQGYNYFGPAEYNDQA